jgi:hypothetical protein
LRAAAPFVVSFALLAATAKTLSFCATLILSFLTADGADGHGLKQQPAGRLASAYSAGQSIHPQFPVYAISAIFRG